jgi:hypothetical protein
MAGYSATVRTPESRPLDKINQLAYHSVHFDAQSLFTRQTGDSETESVDESLQEDSKVFHALISRELSRSVSSSVLTRSSQLQPIHIPGGKRCILFSRLTI